MANVIRDTSTVPPEGWTFPVAQTGVTVRSPNWTVFYSQIQDHCAANNIQPPSMQEVVDYCCAHLHVPCYDDVRRQPLVNKWSQSLPVVLPGCCSGRK